MTERVVADVMTAPVKAVARHTVYKDIVDLLTGDGIGAVPVVDGGSVVGIVSESDLLSKVELVGESLDGRLMERRTRRRARLKAAGDRAAELMSAPAITVRPDSSIVTAARVMDSHHVKHLPVVNSAGALVGIVSRGDLLRVFLRTDESIRDDVRFVVPPEVEVRVDNGVVTLSGRLDLKSMIPIAVRLARGVDGVVDVVADLGYAVDDSRPVHRYAFGRPG